MAFLSNRAWVGCLLLAALFSLAQARAHAATVATCDEASLRAAVNGGGTVTFACDGVITLASTLSIPVDTTLDASGRQVTLSGGNAVRVLDIPNDVVVELVNLTVADGRASNAYGGGMINRGWLRATRCTFTGNQATGLSVYGGAILNFGRLTLNACAFISNSSGGYGGAIAESTFAGPILATNCTFSANAAPSGAALFTFTSLNVTDQVVHCTIQGNFGTGLASLGGTQPPRLVNTILSQNSGGNCSGSFQDGGHNISSDSSFDFNGPGSRVNLDPQLAPLGIWGGPTLTCALIEGSPAMDAADPAACPAVDQRGEARPAGLGCDIGAFEGTVPVQGVVAFSSPVYSADEGGLTATIVVSRSGDPNTSGDVAIATSNGTALAGSDYVGANSVLHFNAGQTSVPFLVSLLDDSDREMPETLSLALSGATGGLWLGQQATTVLTIEDDEAQVLSDCSDAALRAALALGGTIRFNCDGVIPVQDNLAVSAPAYLDANGRNVTLDGGQARRVLSVAPGVSCWMVGLRIANGGGTSEGAGILNAGLLTVRSCVFSNNVASGAGVRGGAISNSGTLDASDCTFVTNRADSATGIGGAIANGAATLSVNRCAFIHNNSGGYGGAVACLGAVGNAIKAGVTNSTFYGNGSASGGSGIYQGVAGTSFVGALHVVHCTLSHNGPRTIAGPAMGPSTLIWVANSIVANCPTPACDALQRGRNILWNDAATSLDPRLAAPAQNGGPTLSMALLSDSPAINQGDAQLCPPADQRGVPRPFGPACDIGAFESTSPPAGTVVEFASAAYQASEAAPSVTISLVRSGNSGPAVSVALSAGGGTAVPGQDYTETNAVVTFDFGQTAATFVIPLGEDTLRDGNKKVNLGLSNPTGGAELGPQAASILTILDNETLLADCSEASLRAALALGGTVTMDCDGVIPLAGSLVIGADVVLDATGRHVTLSGGGAIRPLAVNSGVRFEMRHVTVANGLGAFTGGGLLNNGTAVLLDCTFSNNLASGASAFGGAIYHGPGRLSLQGCLFDGNRASSGGGLVGVGGALSGGYITPAAGPVDILNCTFSRNSATASGGAIGFLCPSGVLNGAIDIAFCTIAGNSNGGVYNCDARAAMTVRNSILSDNHGPNAVGAADGGYNISSDNSSGFNNPLSLHGVDPGLGPLAANGGPTWTMALLPTSPALGAASIEDCPATDQRGFERPYGVSCDIGAFEAYPALSDVRFAQERFSALENEGRALIGVFRDDGNVAPGTVAFSALAQTAQAGSDFVATNGVLTFQTGETYQTFEVALLNDGETEGSESIRLELSNPTGGVTLSLGTQAVLDLIDDEVQVVAGCDEASLRTALSLGGVIRLDCDGVVVLMGGPLVVDHPTILDATGHSVVFSGNNQTRVFHVLPGMAFTLMGATVRDGWHRGADGPQGSPGLPGFGGGIFNQGGQVDLIGCTFQNNQAVGGNGGPVAPSQVNALRGGEARGGALYSAGGMLQASACAFLENLATGGAGRSNASGFEIHQGGAAQGGAMALNHTDTFLMDCGFYGNDAVGGVPGTAQGGTSGVAGPASGGALFAAGGMSEILACAFETNTAASAFPPGPLTGSGGSVAGGAIFLASGSMTVEESLFLSNAAMGGTSRRFSQPGTGSGGGIYNQGALDLLLCHLAGNAATGGAGGSGGNGQGGGLYNAGHCSISHALIENNQAKAGPNYRGSITVGPQLGVPKGGGILNDGSLNLEDSTLAENAASGVDGGFTGGGPISGAPAFGGGIYNTGPCEGVNNTFFGNMAVGGALLLPGSPMLNPYRGGDASGGAIYNLGGAIALSHQTIAANEARGGPGSTPGLGLGGGIYNNPNGQASLVNSILAHGAQGANAYGPIIDQGHNISSDASCLFTGPGSLNETDPVLGPLDDFGGATPTVPLLSGSPAIDAADPASLAPADQRDRPRPDGAQGDIGAFESSAPYTIRGTLAGYQPAAVQVQISGAAVVSDSQGRFRLDGLAPGNYTVNPAGADSVFVPHSRSVSLGPDALGVDFTAYRTNAITLETIGEEARFTYAGPDNQSVRVDFSIDLPQWEGHHEAQTTPDGIHQWVEQPRTNPLPRFFRALRNQ